VWKMNKYVLAIILVALVYGICYTDKVPIPYWDPASSSYMLIDPPGTSTVLGGYAEDPSIPRFWLNASKYDADRLTVEISLYVVNNGGSGKILAGCRIYDTKGDADPSNDELVADVSDVIYVERETFDMTSFEVELEGGNRFYRFEPYVDRVYPWWD